MGYTHYWTYQRDGNQQEWARAVAMIPRILAETDIPLNIDIDDSCISINGKGRCDGGRNRRWRLYLSFLGWRRWLRPRRGRNRNPREDFVIYTVLSQLPPNPEWNTDHPNHYWDLCKTTQSYDTPVTAILATLAHLAPSCITVDTDGDLSDWLPGLQLASLALGYEVPPPACLTELAA